jgi:sec-independent protein translocase protein TatB
MIDFNMSEIVVLAVLAVIIFGPEKLPELARKAARVLNYVRNIANDAQGRLREELGPEFADLHLRDLNPKALVSKHLLEPVQAELEPLKAELEPVRAALTSDPAAPPEQRMAPEKGAQRTVPFDTEAT